MFKVELETLHLDDPRPWADSHLFSEHDNASDAFINANAVLNRMIAPSCGSWRVLVIDTQTHEQTVVHESGGREVSAAGRE